jgi:hypothetical protein
VAPVPMMVGGPLPRSESRRWGAVSSVLMTGRVCGGEPRSAVKQAAFSYIA